MLLYALVNLSEAKALPLEVDSSYVFLDKRFPSAPSFCIVVNAGIELGATRWESMCSCAVLVWGKSSKYGKRTVTGGGRPVWSDT